MCGIAGLLGRRHDAQPIVGLMLQTLAHRGPDATGLWADQATGVALGHRRLSVIDLSPAGDQPMTSASGRYVITYNGEIYNYRQLRTEIEASGRATTWRGHSDTEVLLAGIETWGIERTLQKCNGMFAFALWDTKDKTLYLGRDRIGEKPLYFGWIAGVFAFASELKALLKVPGCSARMEETAICAYLKSGYLHGSQSAIKGIHRLRPGCVLVLRKADLEQPLSGSELLDRTCCYWSMGAVVNDAHTEPESYNLDALDALLRSAVSLRMVSDVPVGAFLSGGIDSSLITALMQVQSSSPVHTFSIGFAERGFDEAPHARAVARHLGTDHTEMYVSADDALALVPNLTEIYDEPFADHSQLPTLLLSRLAKQKVTVALSGDGGDELFGGYGRYIAILKLQRLLTRHPSLPLLVSLARRLTSPLQLAPPVARLHSKLERLYTRINAAHDIDAMRHLFIGTAHARHLAAGSSVDSPPKSLVPEGIGTLRQLMFGDQVDYLPDDILLKVDRASMSTALEARVPLLDHRVVEYSWSLPESVLVRGTRGKLPLRRLLNRYLPAALFERPKQGFAPPLAQWLRGPLQEWADSLLQPEMLRDLPMVDTAAVRSLWQAHTRQRTDAGYALWNVLVLSDWRRRFRVTC